MYFALSFLPTNLATLCLYAHFLSCSFKYESSIRNYISGVKALQSLFNSPFPVTGPELRLALRGIRHLKSRPPAQASAFTLSIWKPCFFTWIYHVLWMPCFEPCFWQRFLLSHESPIWSRLTYLNTNVTNKFCILMFWSLPSTLLSPFAGQKLCRMGHTL